MNAANVLSRMSRATIYAVLIFAALLFVAPISVMILTSLRTADDIRQNAFMSWPEMLTFWAWGEAWSNACIATRCEGLRPYFLNSVLVVAPAVIISTAIGAVNGYALSKWRFPGSELFFGLMLLGCFIPYQAILIPMAQTLGFIGLAGTRAGLVFAFVIYGIPFTTLFFRNYYVGIPDELLRAAAIDGAGFWMTFRRIILPLSPPIIVVTLIWQFTQIWNDFLFGASFSAGPAQPLTVALNNLVNTTTGTKQYNVDMAGAILAAVPTLFVYVLAGRYFLRGLMAGAIKG
jgi:glucose/mannose transport system permease protein